MKNPTPIETSSRTCFAIEWYATEAEADERAAQVVKQGETYNGGHFHGMPCGRDRGWDRPGMFAVTTA